MRKLASTLILLIVLSNCFAQTDAKKLFIGASFSLLHNDLSMAPYQSPTIPYYNNYDEYLISGELGASISPGSMLGFKLGVSSSRITRDPAYYNTNESKKAGLFVSPTYKFIKRIDNNIWFYTDCSVLLQFGRYETTMDVLDVVSSEYETRHQIGNEFQYGVSLHPGIIVNLYKNLGLQIDYALFDITRTSVVAAENSDSYFNTINGWAYAFGTKLSSFNLGIVFLL